MKRISVMIIVALIAVVPMSAQFDFGLKGGLNSTRLKLDEIVNDVGGTSYSLEGLSEASYGFHVGGFVRLTLFGLIVQPEVVFTSSGAEVKVTDILDGGSLPEIKQQDFKKLDVPIMIGGKVGPLRIMAGPSASITIDGPEALIDDADYEELYRGATFGYQAGVGVDILKTLTLDVRYEGNLSRFGNGVKIGNQDFDFDSRPNSFIFSLGLMF